ncbi:hypothetical protein AcW1_005162 [Taiwanofungus camphoratus]|nr:hypothetical protein AcW1_005162 [Antrodia cinnamomea]
MQRSGPSRSDSQPCSAAARQLHPLALAPPPHRSPFRVPSPDSPFPDDAEEARPVPLDGRADAPGVAVQANAAIILRARGRACESLREARAADRDRAAGVEGETVLTVSPSLCPLSPIRAPRYANGPSHPAFHGSRLATVSNAARSQTAHGLTR